MYIVSNKWINDRHEGRQMGAVEVEDTTESLFQPNKDQERRAEEIGTRQAGFRKWQDKGNINNGYVHLRLTLDSSH